MGVLKRYGKKKGKIIREGVWRISRLNGQVLLLPKRKNEQTLNTIINVETIYQEKYYLLWQFSKVYKL